MNGRPIRDRVSPNQGPRQGAAAPDLVLLHYTQMPTAAAALDRLCDPAAQVSAHYLIEPEGAVWRLVPEERRAWHAGASYWKTDLGEAAATDVNSRSIGLELAHYGHDAHGVCPPFPEPQMDALEGMLREILARWRIPARNVLGHSDVAPGRKIDPGEKFDWARLARRGLAETRPMAASAPQSDDADFADAFRRNLLSVGYGDWPSAALADAFRRRWRPAALGRPLSLEDVQLSAALAQRR